MNNVFTSLRFFFVLLLPVDLFVIPGDSYPFNKLSKICKKIDFVKEANTDILNGKYKKCKDSCH